MPRSSTRSSTQRLTGPAGRSRLKTPDTPRKTDHHRNHRWPPNPTKNASNKPGGRSSSACPARWMSRGRVSRARSPGFSPPCPGRRR
jgi:hypothetical protein